jgi:hypothetical protein
MITQKVAANTCMCVFVCLCVCGLKSNTGTDFSPRISVIHSVNSPTHFLVSHQYNINVAIDRIFKQGIYAVIMAIEDSLG